MATLDFGLTLQYRLVGYGCGWLIPHTGRCLPHTRDLPGWLRSRYPDLARVG